MAFIKQETKINGESGEYWRVAHFEPLRIAKKASIAMMCYKSKYYADLEEEDGIARNLWPAETFYIDYSSLDKKFISVDDIYPLLKSQHAEKWGDAVDA